MTGRFVKNVLATALARYVACPCDSRLFIWHNEVTIKSVPQVQEYLKELLQNGEYAYTK